MTQLPPRVRIPWDRPTTPDQHAENLRYIRLGFEGGDGKQWGTFVIAAVDSSQLGRATADFVCDGVHDAATINSAIGAIQDETGSGRLVFLEGTYHISGTISAQMTANSYISLEGQSGYSAAYNTRIVATGASGLFSFTGITGGPSAVGFRNLYLESLAGRAIQTVKVAIDMDSCSVTSGGRTIDLDGGLSGPYAPSRIRSSEIHSTAGSNGRGIVVQHEFDTEIIGCRITTASGRGITMFADTSAWLEPVIADNNISGAGDYGIAFVDSSDGTDVKQGTIIGNRIEGYNNGIALLGSNDTLIVGNNIGDCGTGIQVTGIGIAGDNNALITSNYIHDCATAAVTIGNTTLGTTDIAVVFNKFSNNGSQGSIGSGCVNCAWAYNDAFSSGTFSDSGTSTRRETTYLPTTLDANARVGVRLNNGGSTYLRRRIDFVPTSPITTGIADDSTDEEVDVALGFDQTIDLNNNARLGVRKNSTGSTFKRRRENFIEGANITITVADDSGDEEVDITIAASGGGGTATYKVNGSTVGVESILNLIAGTGVTLGAIDTGTEVDVTISTAAGGAVVAANEFNYAMHS